MIGLLHRRRAQIVGRNTAEEMYEHVSTRVTLQL